MVRKIELVVAGLDLHDEETDELLAEKLSDYGWFSRDGIVTVAVYLHEHDDAVSAACEAANKIEHLAGGQVLRVDEDLVGTSDIAQRTGLHRETVRLLTLGRRGPGGFPTHRGTVGSGAHSTRVWRWDDVLPWLHEHYHLCEDEQPLTANERAQVNAHLAQVVHDFDHAWKRSQFASRLSADVQWPSERGGAVAVRTNRRPWHSVATVAADEVVDGYVAMCVR